MINFNEHSVFNLTPIPVESVQQNVNGLLIKDETIIGAFKTVRDKKSQTTRLTWW